MNSQIMCSWCHPMVEAGARNCPQCGHRADLPRLECDCLKCRITRGSIIRVDRHNGKEKG